MFRSSKKIEEDENSSVYVRSEDLVKFGFIPEFIGRIPVVTSLKQLDQESLIQILTEPKNALIKQYQKLVGLNDNVKLEFTNDALISIASEALKRGTGARGLRSIIENSILDIIYDLPIIIKDEVKIYQKCTKNLFKTYLNKKNSKTSTLVSIEQIKINDYDLNFNKYLFSEEEKRSFKFSSV